MWTNDSGYCWWWLRSPGDAQDNAAYVNDDGDVDDDGNYVTDVSLAVRPAFWLNLES